MVKPKKYTYYAGRGNGKSYTMAQSINTLVKHNNILKWIGLISSVIAVISSIRCLMYNYTIEDLKHENESKTAQIERLEKEISSYKEENDESTN